ncbi:hypothetical protein ACH5RR_039092 [Cinchona calisaya]|uniref:Transposase n=1 Tax=Cinchona calisaya TaxID=153742 RepID=A0ABD2Y2S0_9GENT
MGKQNGLISDLRSVQIFSYKCGITGHGDKAYREDKKEKAKDNQWGIGRGEAKRSLLPKCDNDVDPVNELKTLGKAQKDKIMNTNKDKMIILRGVIPAEDNLRANAEVGRSPDLDGIEGSKAILDQEPLRSDMEIEMAECSSGNTNGERTKVIAPGRGY